MPKFIKVTSSMTDAPVFINIEHIGHITAYVKTSTSSRNEKTASVIGVTTHNNGGFSIKESTDAIMKLISKAKD